MKDGELRVMVIGAHPDDPDLNAGCTVMKLIEAGAYDKEIVAECPSWDDVPRSIFAFQLFEQCIA